MSDLIEKLNDRNKSLKHSLSLLEKDNAYLKEQIQAKLTELVEENSKRNDLVAELQSQLSGILLEKSVLDTKAASISALLQEEENLKLELTKMQAEKKKYSDLYTVANTYSTKKDE